MTMDKLHEAFDALKEYFECNFHTVLWHIVVDRTTEGKLCCFVLNYTKQGAQLGVAFANESGYMPTPAYFKEKLPRDTAKTVLALLNETIFSISEEQAMQILTSSMWKSPATEIQIESE